MRYFVGFAAALALLAGDAAAQDRVVLEPYSSWVANYDEDSCALQRQFGNEGQQAYLELRMFGHNGSMQVVVASKDFKRLSGPFRFALEPADQVPVALGGFDFRFGDGYEGKLFGYSFAGTDPRTLATYREFAATTPAATDEQRKLLIKAFDLDPGSTEFARLSQRADYLEAWRVIGDAFRSSQAWHRLRDTIEAEAAGVSIAGAFDRDLFLRTGELHAPLEAMRTCLDELYSHWGIDVEAHKTLMRAALPLDYPALVREVQEDYPRKMANKRLQGYLRIRLDVSAEGLPTACHLQSPINDDAFERVACDNMMRHAKFAPALDKQGQPLASVYQTSILYVLGRR